MRLSLAVLIALHVPVAAVAAVVERMPALEWRAPTTFAAAPVLLAPSAGLASSAASFAAAPLAALVPAAQLAAARADLTGLGAALIEDARPGRAASAAPARGAALDGTFDGARAAADGPEPVRETEPAARPAALSPAAKAPSRWRTAVPNSLTFANLSSGLAAAFLASEGHFVPAALSIIAANVFDAFDGRAARALGVKNPLGIDYDSLADVVSFGAAPALLIFKAALLPALGWMGFPIAAAFAVAGLFRLARFDVGAHAEESGAVPHKAGDSFTGLPIPGGAGVIVALTLALASIPAALAAPIAAAVTLLTAAAMVSRLPYPAFKKAHGRGLLVPAAVVAAAVAPLIALGLYALIPAAVFGLYLASGPLAALRRRLGRVVFDGKSFADRYADGMYGTVVTFRDPLTPEVRAAVGRMLSRRKADLDRVERFATITISRNPFGARDIKIVVKGSASFSVFHISDAGATLKEVKNGTGRIPPPTASSGLSKADLDGQLDAAVDLAVLLAKVK